MKITALLFSAAAIAVASAAPSAAPVPSPFPAPSPQDPPAPGPDHKAPAPAPNDNGDGYFTTGTTTTESEDTKLAMCISTFQKYCTMTIGKDTCSNCVQNRAMDFTRLGCTPLDIIANQCNLPPRNLRRNLLELTTGPAPFPAPSPEDPPSPSEGHQAPSPSEFYYSVQWPAPSVDQDPVSPAEQACRTATLGETCSYIASGTKYSGSCIVAKSGSMECSANVKQDCDTLFATLCDGTSGKECADCVATVNKQAFNDASCEIPKLISGNCFSSK